MQLITHRGRRGAPALYLLSLKDILRKDVKVSAQELLLQDSGAFTGEIRSASASYSDWTHL